MKINFVSKGPISEIATLPDGTELYRVLGEIYTDREEAARQEEAFEAWGRRQFSNNKKISNTKQVEPETEDIPPEEMPDADTLPQIGE